MKLLPLLSLIPVLVITGCSGTSLVEREDLTSLEARSVYIDEHPGSGFIEYIRNGEIVRGMDSGEVIASWGMPNVYMLSMGREDEFWIYYVRDDEINAVLVYTLRFSPENTLAGWDIDMKRFSGYSLGFYESGQQTSAVEEISIKKK